MSNTTYEKAETFFENRDRRINEQLLQYLVPMNFSVLTLILQNQHQIGYIIGFLSMIVITGILFYIHSDELKKSGFSGKPDIVIDAPFMGAAGSNWNRFTKLYISILLYLLLAGLTIFAYFYK
jgi:hypothetical protein